MMIADCQPRDYKDGVQIVSLTNSLAKQDCVTTNNDSRILKINWSACGITSSSRISAYTNQAIAYARNAEYAPYDHDFLNNKNHTTAGNAEYNCSELVWKAFNKQGGIDLDSNGGGSVYPNNINNPNKVTVVRSFGP